MVIRMIYIPLETRIQWIQEDIQKIKEQLKISEYKFGKGLMYFPHIDPDPIIKIDAGIEK